MMTYIADRKHGLVLACLHVALVIYVTIGKSQSMLLASDARVLLIPIWIVAMLAIIIYAEKCYSDQCGTHLWSYILYGAGLACQVLVAWIVPGALLLSFWGTCIVLAAWVAGYTFIIVFHCPTKSEKSKH